MAGIPNYMQTPKLATGMAAPAGQKTIGPQPGQAFSAPPPAAPFNPRAIKGAPLQQVLDSAPLGGDLKNQLFASKDFTGFGDGYGANNSRWFDQVNLGGDGGMDNGRQTSGLAGSWATPTEQNAYNEGSIGPGEMNPAAIDAFKGNTFDWTQGDRRSGTLTGYDAQGKSIGSWNQAPESSATKDFLTWAALAAGGFGALGAAGAGPMAGLFGGGGAGAAAGAGAGELGALGGLSESVYGLGGALGPGLEAGTIGGLGGSTAGFGGLGSVLPSGVGFGEAAAGLGSLGMDLSTVGGTDPAGLVPGGDPAAGNGAFLGEAPYTPTPTATPYTTAAADSAATSAANGYTGAELAAGGAPASVNLGSLGTYASGGGVMDKIANALQSAQVNPGGALQSAGSGLLDFAKKNPQLAAMGVGALGSLTGSTPDMPAMPGAGAGGAGAGAAAPAGAFTPPTPAASGLMTSAGDRNTFNQDATDAAYGLQTRYLDPQIKQQQAALEARLSEQGFVPGTPAYNQAMQNFMDTNQRAYASARDSSILQGAQIGQGDYRNAISGATLNNSAVGQALSDYIAARAAPINERSATLNGDQVLYNRNLDKYNAQVAESNSRNQSLSQLALALGMYLG